MVDPSQSERQLRCGSDALDPDDTCPPFATGPRNWPVWVEAGHSCRVPVRPCRQRQLGPIGPTTRPIAPPWRRNRETYLSAQQLEEGPQARVQGPYRYPWGSRRPTSSPTQGPQASECVIESVGRKRTFAELRRNGRRVRHGSVRMSHLPIETSRPQVAFALGRSFGNAVERNRGRRRLRAAFVEVVSAKPTSARPTGAFLLTGSRGLLTDPFSRLTENVEACLAELASTPAVQR